MVKLLGLSTGFSGKAVTQSCNLHINQGEILSLIGPNGCGKTTLLKPIAGLIAPLSGKIEICSRDISSYSRKELAQIMAFLPQIRAVPNIDVQTLVSHGRFPHLKFSRRMTERDRQQIELAMEMTGVSDLRRRNVSSLSGGERQRVYIAMTLAQEAKLLIWDEPTTYLDLNCQFDILELAKKLNIQGITIVMSMHDVSAALEYSHSVCVMGRKGEICSVDSPNSIFASGIIEELYNVSAAEIEKNNRKLYFFYR